MDDSNNTFSELATWFVTPPEDGDDIVLPAFLDRKSLDYSVESLKKVDAYLNRIRESAPENVASGRWLPTVLRAGAYVGEAFARAAAKTLNWYEYSALINARPDLKGWLGDRRTLGNNVVLATADLNFMTAPHGKVCKFIWDGPEDSVWYYVETFLPKVNGTV